MPRGDKSAYTDKQKRQAEHIEEGYRKQGLSDETAEARAWATVNKQDGGGTKSGSGRARPPTSTATRRASKSTGTAKRASKSARAATTRKPAKKTARKSAGARRK